MHAVGPVWGEGDEDQKLADSISGSLALRDRLGFTSIAFPATSTGVFRFPMKRAAKIILGEIKNYFNQNPGNELNQVRVVLFDEGSVSGFRIIAGTVLADCQIPDESFDE
jgi:O-acetyl-ADP-ribose deacetylase (regulator of RNase III)